jgi:hypothetical protein
MTSQDKHKIDRLKRKVCDSIFSHVADAMWSYTNDSVYRTCVPSKVNTKVWIQSWTWTRAYDDLIRDLTLQTLRAYDFNK